MQGSAGPKCRQHWLPAELHVCCMSAELRVCCMSAACALPPLVWALRTCKHRTHGILSGPLQHSRKGIQEGNQYGHATARVSRVPGARLQQGAGWPGRMRQAVAAVRATSLRGQTLGSPLRALSAQKRQRRLSMSCETRRQGVRGRGAQQRSCCRRCRCRACACCCPAQPLIAPVGDGQDEARS